MSLPNIIQFNNVNTDDLPLPQKYCNFAKRVFSSLGPGHTENIYHKAMEYELRFHNISYESEKIVPIQYQDYNEHYFTLGYEKIDLYIPNDEVIIELKAMITAPRETEIAQVHKYQRELLKYGIMPKYGLIINFPQSGIKTAKDDIDFIEIIFDYK